jgi:hypothetical protein
LDRSLPTVTLRNLEGSVLRAGRHLVHDERHRTGLDTQ